MDAVHEHQRQHPVRRSVFPTHPAQWSHSAGSTERVMSFFDTYRQLYPVSREVLCGTADMGGRPSRSSGNGVRTFQANFGGFLLDK